MNDLRVAALNQAAMDEKHSGGSGMVYLTPPDCANVVKRAEVYLKFLLGHQPTQKLPKEAPHLGAKLNRKGNTR